MPLRRRTAALLVGAAALAVSVGAPAAHAQDPFKASFTAAPDAPERGEPVLLTATTTGAHGSQSTLVHTWDLDGDGAFDDATGTSVTTRFDTAGAHVVRLRATYTRPNQPAQTQTAERTFTIAADPAPPKPEQPPATTPATPAPPAPPANQAPTAVIDRECTRHGRMRLCTAHIAYQGTEKKLTAVASSDADGEIHRYEWDLDGDGTFETDTGAIPAVDHTFEPRSSRRIAKPVRQWPVSVRVTDDQGATATATMTIDVRPARCQDVLQVGAFTAKGTCLRPVNAERDGKAITSWRSTEPVSLNGMAIEPRAGQWVAFELPRGGSGADPRIASRNATVSMNAGGTYAVVTSGQFAWTPKGSRLQDFHIDAKSVINGLKLTSVVGEPELKSNKMQAQVYVAMPAQFGGATSGTPVTLGAGVARAAGADDAFSFSVPNAALGPIGLDTLKVTYDGIDLWEVEASISLPAPAAVNIRGAAGIRDTGRFAYGEAEMAWDHGFALGGPIPVFLQRIKFRIEVEPGESARCVPNVGKKEIVYPKGAPRPVGVPERFTIDFGYPTFALCGEVVLTAGPAVSGKAVAQLTAGLGWATYADRPWVMRAFGDLKIAGMPFGEARFAVYGDGYITAAGKVATGLGGIASIEGALNVEIYRSSFNASGRVEACVDLVDLCAGASAIVSSRGVAACLKLGTPFGDWKPGVGYLWGDSFPDLYFSGCGIGRYRATINRKATAAQATGARSFDLEDGLPGTSLVVKGDGTAAPKVTITGPGGRTITPLEPGRRSRMADDHVLVEDPRSRTTQVLIAKPAGGRWTVTPGEGTTVTAVLAADGLDAPEVSARVGGRGQDRVLTYRVKPVAGQKVTFVERGGSAGGELGAATGAAGALRFTPAEGAAEQRTIVALIEQDGLLREERVVARYRASRAARPARAQRLQVAKRGGVVRASWRTVAGARSYTVAAKLGNGRTVVRQVRVPRIRIAGAGRGGRAQVTVTAITPSGIAGPAVTAKAARR